MSPRQVRVAVVGCGVFGLEHLDALSRVPEAQVVAVCDANMEVANRAAELFRVPRIVSNFGDLLTSRTVDAVVLAVPSPLHAEMAAACIQAGKHLLIEKPFAVNVREAEDLVALAGKHDEVIVLPGHILRYSRPHRRIHSAIREGEVGFVQSFIAERDRELGHHDRYSDTSPTFLTMIHDIDMALWMTGQTPTTVTALATCAPHRAQPSVITATVQTQEDSTWSLRCSWALPRGCDNEDRLRVLGTAGTISWANTPDFTLRRGVQAVGPLLSSDRLFASEIDDEVAHFIECIREGRHSDRVNVVEAALGVSIAEAVDRSWQQGGAPQDVT